MPGAPIPALLNNKSSRPKVSLVLVNKDSIAGGEVTSVGKISARELAEPASLAVFCKASPRRPARVTQYPSCKRAIDVRWPMLEPAPVTIATFLIELILYYLPLGVIGHYIHH